MSSKNDVPSSGETTNGAPDGPAVVPDDSADVQSRDNLGRRTFVKGLGATAAAGLGVKYVGSPVGEAEAIAPLLVAGAIGLTAGAVGGIAFGATFGGPDDSQVADSLDWQTHVDEFTRAREDQLALEETIASLKRDVQLVENKAREEAIFRIYEQGVDSGTESDATAAAEAAIDEAYTTVQKSILNSFSIRLERANAVANIMDSGQFSGSVQGNALSAEFSGESDSNTSGTYDAWGNTASILVDDGNTTLSTRTVTLFDGTSFDYTAGYASEQNGSNESYTAALAVDSYFSDASGDFVWDTVFIEEPMAADYGTVDSGLDVSYTQAEVVNTYKWAQVWSDLSDRHSTVKGEVSSMVDSYFQPAKDGEIDLFEAVGPQHLTDTAKTAVDYQEAAMALRAMGYPMSKQVVTVEVPTEDGSGMELTGRLSWTAHQGNGLTVGKTLNPTNIPGSIFAAVNLPDGVDSLDGNTTNTTNTTDDGSTDTGPGAEIVELTGGFEILSAEGASEVTFEDRTLASSDLTNDQINQIFKENYQANKEATETVHDTATGGGGGWSGLSSSGKGLLVAAAGAVGYGFLKGN